MLYEEKVSISLMLYRDDPYQDGLVVRFFTQVFTWLTCLAVPLLSLLACLGSLVNPKIVYATHHSRRHPEGKFPIHCLVCENKWKILPQFRLFFGRFSAIKTKSTWQNLEFLGKKLEFFEEFG